MEQQGDGLTSDVRLVTQRPAAVSPVVPLQSVASAGGHPSQAPAITCLPIQAPAAALTTPALEDSKHNDIALRCDGNTKLQAAGIGPGASQQRLNGGGLASGTQAAAAAMDVVAAAVKEAAAADEEAAAAESAATPQMEEAAAPEAEAVAAATEEAAAPEAAAAPTEEAAAPEAAPAATNEAATSEAAPAATNEAATSEAASTAAAASQIAPDMQDEVRNIVKETNSKSQSASPSSLVQMTAVESLAAASGVQMGADVERSPDLHALQMHHTSSP